VLACLGREDVNDDIQVVQQRPAPLGHSLPASRQQPLALLEAQVDGIVDGLDLAVRATGADDQVIRVADQAAQVQGDDVLRLAVSGQLGGDERFEVSDLELGRDGPSYTVDTLQGLHARAPHDELVLILGGDIAAGLGDWHRVQRVLELATVAVAGRRGTSRESVQDALAGLKGGERARFFAMPRIAISSTQIRRRVGAGQPIRYLVTEPVRGYIERRGLYREDTSPPPQGEHDHRIAE
jgi:nicotinate (nicotinamide) nucleotide adenylyltransferase